MTLEEIVSELKRIDYTLYMGDKELAHAKLWELIRRIAPERPVKA